MRTGGGVDKILYPLLSHLYGMSVPNHKVIVKSPGNLKAIKINEEEYFVPDTIYEDTIYEDTIY